MDFVREAKNPNPPFLNEQYQDWYNTSQSQMRNAYSFYIIFQVLKVLLIKIWKIQQPDLLFLVVFISFDISIITFQTFLELHSTLSEKKFFSSYPKAAYWVCYSCLPGWFATWVNLLKTKICFENIEIMKF